MTYKENDIKGFPLNQLVLIPSKISMCHMTKDVSTGMEDHFWKAEDQIKNAELFSVLNMYNKYKL